MRFLQCSNATKICQLLADNGLVFTNTSRLIAGKKQWGFTKLQLRFDAVVSDINLFFIIGGFMKISRSKFFTITLIGLTLATAAFAADSGGGGGIGGIANKVTDTMGNVGKLMVAISYLAGFGFLTFGVLKFKQHKDNPSQVPLGTPITMTLIGAVLVFIGGFIAPLGETFGLSEKSAGGFTGSGASSVPGGGDGGGS